MAQDEVRKERIKKLDILTSTGKEGYPAKSNRSISIEAYLASFDTYIENNKTETLAGRVLSIRGQGGIAFMDVFDGTARIQFVLEKSEIGEEQFKLFQDVVDQGDFIEVAGTAYLTKRGEKSLKGNAWTMLSKSLSALPSEWYGLQDPELKLRQRYIDILIDPDLRALFERRSKFWQTVRNFYLEKHFLEMETPVLESSPGGAEARPFETHHNALDIDVSLRISLELWLKRLLVSGFPKVFEIGRIFRNEGQSREHLQDYTQVESYEAYKDMQYGMKFVQELYRKIAAEVYGKSLFIINGHDVDFADEWEVMDFGQIIKDKFGLDPISEMYLKTGNRVTLNELKEICEKAGIEYESAEFNITRTVDNLWKSIRKEIKGPAFLVGIPVSMEPLAKRSLINPLTVERFQIILAGSEMGKGFSELNDPQDQRARFEEQQKMRDKGDVEAQRLDEEFVEAMEYGMPPSFGFGMSERLFAFLENRSAHETQIFPLLRPKQ